MDRSTSDRIGGLSYRPLSRPASNHSSTNTPAFPDGHGGPSKRGNFGRTNRSNNTGQFPPLTSIDQLPMHRFPNTEQASRYPTPAITSAHNDSSYTVLPPGAYVNPAFFNRVNQGTLLSSPPNLPQNIQQQMDILNYFKQFSNG